MNTAKPNHTGKAIDILEDALLQLAFLEQRAQNTDPEMAKTLFRMCNRLNELIVEFAEDKEVFL